MTAQEAAYSSSFGEVAALYDRSRPRYATRALRWALGAVPLRIVDLGAGTGILTRQLTDLGHLCTAVEPDPGMRSHFRRTTDTPILPGTAEDIPLPDDSVDAIVAAESYHWFDPHRAQTEFARVLKPGGILVLLWNIRDEATPWVAELTLLLSRYDRTGKAVIDDPVVAPPFLPLVRREFTHTVRHSLDSLLDLYRSHSYHITAPPSRRNAFEADLQRLVRTHADLKDRERLELPYHTRTYRTQFSPGPR
ncbi:class I SAM-dependent methyltransferase [Streptomyces sp. SID3343]|uniref:class I SAM-dependent methyltransferase n=1 Tax=Streptomyces sp. SID3343 TaxID=2690260 RepID=UPI001370B80B|nr:class I SAM-dependent methyltransferase [Streptomyces sp. SID3343]MYV97066.1 methyltransferase domain-containing protein [Streptomyces sp. SID3343]